jgi:hypothetical protein
MPSSLKMEISTEEIIAAVLRMDEDERQDFLEDLLAATSPEYLKSIREARQDYEAGRVSSHEDLFGK